MRDDDSRNPFRNYRQEIKRVSAIQTHNTPFLTRRQGKQVGIPTVAGEKSTQAAAVIWKSAAAAAAARAISEKSAVVVSICMCIHATPRADGMRVGT